MHASIRGSILIAAIVAAAPIAPAPNRTENLDLPTIARIRDEGLNRSQVMDHVSWLSDVYGPRLTGGPGILQASDWAIGKFNEWGLVNAYRETWPFGNGWSLVRFTAHMIEPQVQPIIGLPASWTRGTNGTVTADVVHLQIDTEADFEKYRGRLAGKIVLTQSERDAPMLEGLLVHRMDEKGFAEAATMPPAVPGDDPGDLDDDQPVSARRRAARASRIRIARFFEVEGVAAAFNRGSDDVFEPVGSALTSLQQRTDGGTIFPIGDGSRLSDGSTGVPTVTLAVEHYNRIVRILAKNIPVKVELNVQTRFHEETTASGFNTIAEIPGSDPALRNEVVILGAHLDSDSAGTGATDNATGSAAIMEAMRILKAIGARPRRTIRVALWGGEEQGRLGSRAYVRHHYGDSATRILKPEHGKVAAYFNSDNGTGRVRGIWLQNNAAAGLIFEDWMKPLADLGVTAVGPRSVGSTDHVSFDAVGLPGFQFMVDRLEYNSRTHHSNMDVYDRVQRSEMVQHATVVAVFAYNAAMRDEKLPRKPLPGPGQWRTGQ